MWRQLVLFAAVLAVGLAAVAIAPLQSKPAKYQNVSGCYYKEYDQVYPVGSSVAAKSECRQYNCRQNDYTIFTCGPVRVDPPCYTTSDVSKKYPDCCPQIQCPPSK